MPDPRTVFYEGPPRAERDEVITSVRRRRRWSTQEKVPDRRKDVSARQLGPLVARRDGIADAGLVAAIQTFIADPPTYDRRVHVLLRRQPSGRAGPRGLRLREWESERDSAAALRRQNFRSAVRSTFASSVEPTATPPYRIWRMRAARNASSVSNHGDALRIHHPHSAQSQMRSPALLRVLVGAKRGAGHTLQPP
jgi:hypothetical protein